MTRPTALDALAYLIHEIRSDWDRAGILAVLQRQPDRIPLADLAVAAVTAAHTRHDQRAPAVIGLTGSHWDHPPSGQRPASVQPTWRAPEQTTPPASPATIAAMRAELDARLATIPPPIDERTRKDTSA